MTPLVEAAVKLGARGLPVFPCVPRHKEPLFGDNLQLASCDQVIIRRYWDPTDCNIGIATGRRAGVWVLDVDGHEGEATLAALEAEHGKLPATVEVITGNDGRHLYFAWPRRLEIRNNPSTPDHEAAFPSLHWRGDGGYVLAVGSIHPDTGREYMWSVDSANTFAPAPQWLLDLVVIERRRKAVTNSGAAASALPSDWEALVSRQHSGSRRAGALAKFSGLLLRKYLDPAVVIALAGWFDERLCEPPLGHDEVLRIFHDIAEREADRRDGR